MPHQKPTMKPEARGLTPVLAASAFSATLRVVFLVLRYARTFFRVGLCSPSISFACCLDPAEGPARALLQGARMIDDHAARVANPH